MSSTGSRALSSSTKAALRWAGATKNEILSQNPGDKGKQALKAIEAIEAAAEQKYGDKAHTLRIQGGKLHKSTKDPNETLEVITVSVETAGGTRLESDHAREDGTTTQKVTRAGGKK